MHVCCVPEITKQMSRNRFLYIERFFHVLDPDTVPEAEKGDIFWRVRPLADAVRDNCRESIICGQFQVQS